MFRYILRFLTLKKLVNLAKWSLPRNHKITQSRIRNWSFGFCSIYGIGVVYANSESVNIVDNFEEEMKKATEQGEKYLAQLMLALRTLILQTSIEYQQNLIKQIELTKQNTELGPLGEHWDGLIAYRVKGTELKEELNKYQALAKSIAGIVHVQFVSTLSGSKAVLDELTSELTKLQQLCNEQLEEISRYETELLQTNRDSILHGMRSK